MRIEMTREEWEAAGGLGNHDGTYAYPPEPLPRHAISYQQLMWHRSGSKGAFDQRTETAHENIEPEVQAKREAIWRQRGWSEEMIVWYRAGHKGPYLACTASCCMSPEDRKRFSENHPEERAIRNCSCVRCKPTKHLHYHAKDGFKPVLKAGPALVGRMKKRRSK